MFCSRLLHKAVAQGRRALTYALARRFASLNKIDEKDAEKRVGCCLAKSHFLWHADAFQTLINTKHPFGQGVAAILE